MDQRSYEEMLERLSRLESRHRRLQRLAGALLIGAFALSVGSALAPKGVKEVVAERFLLKDDAGKVRATLDVREDGASVFTLCDKDGKFRMGLGVHPEGRAGLRICDKQGDDLINIRVDDDGLARLYVSGKESRQDFIVADTGKSLAVGIDRGDGKPQVRLGFTPEMKPRLSFYDDQGRSRCELGMDKGDGGNLVLLRNDGEPSLVATVDDEDNAGLYLFDRKKRGRAGIALPNDENGIIFLADEQRKTRLRSTLSKDGTPRVEFRDRDGKPSKILP